MRSLLRPLLLPTLFLALAAFTVNAGPSHVFVHGDRTPVAELEMPLRHLVNSLEVGSTQIHEMARETLVDSLTQLEGSSHYRQRAKVIYEEFDREDVMSFVREFALWNRFIEDYPQASLRYPYVIAHWLLARDRVLTVAGFDEASEMFSAVASTCTEQSSEFEKYLHQAAAMNVPLLQEYLGQSSDIQ